MKFSTTIVALSLVLIGVQSHELPSRYAAQRRGNQFVTGLLRVHHGQVRWPRHCQTRDGGCGFGNRAPNCNVAKALGLSECVKGAVNGDISSSAVQTAAAFTAKLDNLPFTPAKKAAPKPAKAAPKPAKAAPKPARNPRRRRPRPSHSSPRPKSRRRPSSRPCAGPDVAQTNGSGGCGHGAASPNCNVATLLGFKNCIGGVKNGNLKDATIQAAAAFAAQLDGIPFKPARR
ncbi:hypothetical protein B0H13DRAFT_2320276 [Mycena leptocephala]|nr:hypothetical protein B0H13DRAFT_2320276 [Mycena leptocephala]